MKSYLSTHLLIAINTLILALIMTGTAWYIHSTREHSLAVLTGYITANTATLKELAELTDRNGADELTARIINDCPRRDDFERQLNSLGSASKKELLSVQQLFESCGAFYAERKALMVSRLEQVYAVLSNDLDLLETMRDLSGGERLLYGWKNLIELEKTRSSLLTEQTSIQEEIITLLIQGTDTRAHITELVGEAQSVNESLSITDVQIDELRLSLTQ
jgi:hypothetical protein